MSASCLGGTWFPVSGSTKDASEAPPSLPNPAELPSDQRTRLGQLSGSLPAATTSTPAIPKALRPQFSQGVLSDRIPGPWAVSQETAHAPDPKSAFLACASSALSPGSAGSRREHHSRFPDSFQASNARAST